MFEELFSRKHCVENHRSSPLADERARFLRHRSMQQYAPATIRELAFQLIVIIRRMHLTELRKVTLEEIDVAAESWARHQRRRLRARSLRSSRKRFRHAAISWFRFLGKLQEPHTRAHRDSRVEAYESFLREERGLSEETINRCCWHAEHLLSELAAKQCTLRRMTVRNIDVYLSRKAAAGWQRSSLLTVADALRSFVRYAEQHHLCPAGIASVISAPRLYQQEHLTQGPDWESVQKVVKSSAGPSARDIRDHAILLLLTVYGLRCCEVLGLSLDDLDWEHDLLQIRRSKQRCAQQYPLQATVGEAILRYLRQARPHCRYRHVFLTLNAPPRPMSHGSIYNVVRRRLDALRVSTQRRGPHALRHACAAHLLAAGFSLKQIGDHLGHRSASATRMYAKVDFKGLREVADIDLRGLL